MGGLTGLPGLEAVESQLEDVIVVLRAEQGRRAVGAAVRRPAWKNLVFTGGPGTGKSRTAAAVGGIYRDLGVLSRGHVIAVPAADLAGTAARETGELVAKAARYAGGGVLLVTGADAWHGLPGHGEQVLRRVYEKLTEYRGELNDDLAVILAGQAGPLRQLLSLHPPLAARFRAVIDFPGYSPGHLTEIFAALAGEAGLTLTPAAWCKAAALFARAEGNHHTGSARLSVELLNQVTVSQARRVATGPQRQDPAMLSTVTEADLPGCLASASLSPGEERPGQYL